VFFVALMAGCTALLIYAGLRNRHRLFRVSAFVVGLTALALVTPTILGFTLIRILGRNAPRLELHEATTAVAELLSRRRSCERIAEALVAGRGRRVGMGAGLATLSSAWRRPGEPPQARGPFPAPILNIAGACSAVTQRQTRLARTLVR